MRLGQQSSRGRIAPGFCKDRAKIYNFHAIRPFERLIRRTKYGVLQDSTMNV